MGIVEDISAEISAANTKIEAGVAAVGLVQSGIDSLQAQIVALRDQVAQGSPASLEQLESLRAEAQSLSAGSKQLSEALDAAAADIAADSDVEEDADS